MCSTQFHRAAGRHPETQIETTKRQLREQKNALLIKGTGCQDDITFPPTGSYLTKKKIIFYLQTVQYRSIVYNEKVRM